MLEKSANLYAGKSEKLYAGTNMKNYTLVNIFGLSSHSLIPADVVWNQKVTRLRFLPLSDHFMGVARTFGSAVSTF